MTQKTIIRKKIKRQNIREQLNIFKVYFLQEKKDESSIEQSELNGKCNSNCIDNNASLNKVHEKPVLELIDWFYQAYISNNLANQNVSDNLSNQVTSGTTNQFVSDNLLNQVTSGTTNYYY